MTELTEAQEDDVDVECDGPCDPDNAPCPACVEYWNRMEREGFWNRSKHEWTRKGMKEMTK